MRDWRDPAALNRDLTTCENARNELPFSFVEFINRVAERTRRKSIFSERRLPNPRGCADGANRDERFQPLGPTRQRCKIGTVDSALVLEDALELSPAVRFRRSERRNQGEPMTSRRLDPGTERDRLADHALAAMTIKANVTEITERHHPIRQASA